MKAKGGPSKAWVQLQMPFDPQTTPPAEWGTPYRCRVFGHNLSSNLWLTTNLGRHRGNSQGTRPEARNKNFKNSAKSSGLVTLDTRDRFYSLSSNKLLNEPLTLRILRFIS